MAEILKFKIEVEVEVTNLRKLAKHAKSLPNFAPTEGEDRLGEDGKERPDVDLEDYIMESVQNAIEGVPGIQWCGQSTMRVDWFEHDHIVDKRHPDYKKRR